MNWFINRFKEASTWRGVIVLAGILGYSINPEMQEHIIAIGTAAIAVLEIVRKEKPNVTTTTKQGDAGVGTTTIGQTIGSPELTDEQRKQYGLDN